METNKFSAEIYLDGKLLTENSELVKYVKEIYDILCESGLGFILIRLKTTLTK